MIKGDKIRLVKPIGAFTNVGEICEVTDVTEGGVISFRFGAVHLGCMSYDEYEKYFERVELPKKREWSKWKNEKISFYDMNDRLITIDILYRDNEKKIQVKHDNCRAESTCNKVDTFDFNKGFELATKRLIVKYLDRQVKEFASAM